MLSRFYLFLILLVVGGEALWAEAPAPFEWQSWSDQQFKKAQAEHKLVLLDLEAVWCHWCHVMDQETYANPQVAKLIRHYFIPIKVDQDARPDLALRYQEFGWPATIFFNGKGEELAKKSGFIEPDEMEELLSRLVKDPSPISEVDPRTLPTVSNSDGLPEALRRDLEERHHAAFDMQLGGLALSHKYLERDTLEYALFAAGRGSDRDTNFAKISLENGRKLIDPVWGGVYQYSTYGDWDHPHFEKIIPSQASVMKIYALAYLLWREPAYEQSARAIHQYVTTFLRSPEGVFFTSQDADLVKGTHSAEYFALGNEARRQRGIPSIDTHIYSRENGWIIQALCYLYQATGDRNILSDSQRAARWIIKNRTLPEGGYAHGESDGTAGPYLGDALAMGVAFLRLYSVSAEREWLERAENAAQFIAAHFVDGAAPGFITSARKDSDILKPVRTIDENVDMARFANLLYRYVGKGEYREFARRALQFFADERITKERISDSGILLADYEISHEPLHLTVVGAKSDRAAQELFSEVGRYFSTYKRQEWWDPSEGPLPRMDVQYPKLERAAAYVCTEKRCSTPVFDVLKLAATVDHITGLIPLTITHK